MTDVSSQSIGIFDSGIGGLSVLQHIQHLLPHENIIYVADSLHAPYGNKPTEFIQHRSLTILDFFIKQRVKAVVIACNTATYAAAQMLRDAFPHLPIIGMEPGIKPAVIASQNGRIGSLATENTLSSTRF
jgi:glutamate racemase